MRRKGASSRPAEGFFVGVRHEVPPVEVPRALGGRRAGEAAELGVSEEGLDPAREGLGPRGVAVQGGAPAVSRFSGVSWTTRGRPNPIASRRAGCVPPTSVAWT